jgi:transcriptional regulator with XRE-family HTH domain
MTAMLADIAMSTIVCDSVSFGTYCETFMQHAHIFEYECQNSHCGGIRIAANRPKEKASRLVKCAVARILQDLEQRGGLKGSDVANIVNASRPSVSRWKSGKASPPLATQAIIADLRYVVDRLSDFYTPAETRLWLHAKHPLLKNERAIDLIIADRTQEVLAVIERLDSGAYL